MTIAHHLVASTRGRVRTLLLPEHARWLWEHLRRNLPAAFACVLMPDHVHVVAPPGAQSVFIHVLAGFTTRFGVRFEHLPPQPAHSIEIARRMVRYVLLNPVSEGLVDDPWSWRWSTLRDLAGAVHPIWTPAERVASTLAIAPSWLLQRLTSGRDHEPIPPRRGSETVVASVDALRASVGAALRITIDDVRTDLLARRLVVQAAHALGLTGVARLAAELGCAERTVRRDRTRPHPALDAVLLGLADGRLRAVDDQKPANSRGPRAETRRI